MNILLDGIFYNGHGFAEGNRILLRILDQAGYRVRISARDAADKHTVLSPEEIRYISSFERTPLTSNDLYISNLVGSLIRHNPDFHVNIARTTFETDRIPDFWVPELNKFDEVWVQCNFNMNTFKSSGVKVPIQFIPHFFDVVQYDPKGKKMVLPVPESFRFLSIFDLQERKGYDLLLLAFLNEFSRDESASLIVKIRDSRGIDRLEQMIDEHPKSWKEKPPVYIIDQMLPFPDLLGLYRACDAFVLPTRGEGWGRPFFEAMLMELPVIGTNWSGQLEYMNGKNAYLIHVDSLTRIRNNEISMFNGHRWAEPSVKDLQRIMRHVYANPKDAVHKGKAARKELLAKYSLNETAKYVEKEINKFGRRLGY